MNDAKTQLVLNWLTKAKNDLASARVLAATFPPLFETALYHCQQAAEKAVKDFLAFHDQEVRRIHDLEILIRSAMKCSEEFANWIEHEEET